jgi:phosphoacetylglucosamine mutase
VGVFVAILNKTQPSKSLGVVMSASHNKIQDNGVKITNFSGNMLEISYEVILEKFVNEKDL